MDLFGVWLIFSKGGLYMKPYAAILSKICFEDVHLFQSN